MDRRLVAFAVIGFIALVIDRSDAITCYSCDSATRRSCLDPFSASGVNTCTGATCTKSWSSGSGVTVVTRNCLSTATETDVCADASVPGASAKTCACSSDYCNDSAVLTPLYKYIVTAVIAAIMTTNWVNKI